MVETALRYRRSYLPASALASAGRLGRVSPLARRYEAAPVGRLRRLDPRPRQSGTSIDTPRPICQSRLNLRTALYMPALVAVRLAISKPDQRIAKGQKPKQALVAVMRKLLHTIWGVWPDCFFENVYSAAYDP